MRRDERLIGAAEERRQILRKIRRMAKSEDIYDEAVLDLLEAWILERDTRFRKRPGGLGAKKAAKR